ncbi:hypothetical protein [Kribbella sp. CA-247076]|uniref:hypothetical protein n=1 Tax=Kribbella sp. CA-247076 TaxID=3239941 RepID=UPI003D8D5002
MPPAQPRAGGDPACDGGLTMPPEPSEDRDPLPDSESRTEWRDLLAIVVLSVTAILTAWTGFESAKWGGAMSIAFSEASSARIEAVKLEGTADRKLSVQVSLFTQWLQAYQDGDQELSAFLAARFPEPLATAFREWLASRPLQNADAAETPFDLPGYVIPEQQQAQQADARADQKFSDALRNNQQSDDYTILTVGFATVLFFAALSGRVRSNRVSWLLLTLAGAGLLVLGGVLLSFPRLL